MNVSLGRELADLLRRKMASGGYDSPEQVIEEALQLLEERDHLRELRRERLVREIANGIFEADSRHVVEASEVFRGLAARAHVPDE